MDEMEGTSNESQLAVQLEHVPLDNILTNWAAACYAIFPMLLLPIPPPYNQVLAAQPLPQGQAVLPPPNLPEPPKSATEAEPIQQQQPAEQAAMQHQANNPTVATLAIHAPAQQPFDEARLAQLVANAMAKTLQQVNQVQHQNHMVALEAAIPEKPSDLSGLNCTICAHCIDLVGLLLVLSLSHGLCVILVSIKVATPSGSLQPELCSLWQFPLRHSAFLVNLALVPVVLVAASFILVCCCLGSFGCFIVGLFGFLSCVILFL